ncbi:hypothetical protein HYO25_15430 [Vibrio parahaemolyticus]|nr:hypothetical protein [Vibrio parahaemolyticus]
MWLNFIRDEHRKLTPESKFIVVRLAHCCAKHESVAGDSVKALSKKFGVSDRTVSMALDWLTENKYFDRARGNFSDSFTQKYSKNEADCVGEPWVKTIEDLLVKRDEIGLLKCTARRMFLIVLLAHADEFGVVSQLSLAKLARLLGRFSKDRHKSQLNYLRQHRVIIGYQAGFTDGKLFGKKSSRYLLNLAHPIFGDNKTKKVTYRDVAIFKSRSEFLLGSRLERCVRTFGFAQVPDKAYDLVVRTLIGTESSGNVIQSLNESQIFFLSEVAARALDDYLMRCALKMRLAGVCQIDKTNISQFIDTEELLSKSYRREVEVSLFGGDNNNAQRGQRNDELLTYVNEVLVSRLTEDEKYVGTEHEKHLAAFGHIVVLATSFLAKECLLMDVDVEQAEYQTFLSEKEGEIELWVFGNN